MNPDCKLLVEKNGVRAIERIMEIQRDTFVDAINYGQLVKERDNGRFVGKTRTIIFSSLEVDEIETVYVDQKHREDTMHGRGNY